MNNKASSIDYSKYISLPVTLDEIRFTLDLEFNRKNSLESKASLLIAFIALFLTIVTLNWKVSFFYRIPFYLPLVISLLYCLKAITPSEYKFPHKEIGDFYQYVKKPEKEVMDQFLLDLVETTKSLETINNEKGEWLKIAYRLFILSIPVFLFCAIIL